MLAPPREGFHMSFLQIEFFPIYDGVFKNALDQKCIFLTKKDFILNLRTSNFSCIVGKISFDTRFSLYIFFFVKTEISFMDLLFALPFFQDARQTIWRLSFVNPIGGTIHSQFVSLSFSYTQLKSMISRENCFFAKTVSKR